MQNEQTPAAGPSLLPCPFCGGEASDTGTVRYSERHEAWWQDGSRIVQAFFINCMKCGCDNRGMLGFQTRDKAIAAWNRRPNVASPASSSSVVQGDAGGVERAHGPKCWGTTSFSDEVAHCYCGPSEDRPQPSGETREAVILKGIGKINGDGWKDTTTKGEVVFVWNAEKPAPYSPGQYPRIGNEGWSASTSQYDFTPASADDIAAIIALLRPAAPDAGGGEDLAGKLKAIRDKFLFPTPDKDHTDYAVMTRCIAALQPGGER